MHLSTSTFNFNKNIYEQKNQERNKHLMKIPCQKDLREINYIYLRLINNNHNNNDNKHI